MEQGHAQERFGTPEEMLEHAGWVRALARALVRDAATADDIAQETWLAALRRAPPSSSAIRPWLARVVRNLAIDRARADVRRATREADASASSPSPEHAPDEVAESIETQKLLLAAVEKLPDPLRSAVVRRYFHGKTSVEIAKEDGVGESTVRERIERGLQALRRELDTHHRGDRSAWMAVLVPIARRADTHVASTAAVATGIGVAMGITWKIGIAALVVVAAFVGVDRWTSASNTTVQLAQQPRTAELDAATNGITTPKTSSSRESVIVPATAQVDAASGAAARVDRIAWVEARIVDKAGIPIAGAQLACVDLVDRARLEHKAAPFAACAADGHVRLELHQSDSQGRGGYADRPDTAWSTQVEASAPNHAPHRAFVEADEGRTSSSGTIVLVEGGTIAGRVVDENGDALTEVTVRVVRPDMTLEERDRLPWNGLGNDSLAHATTAADGTYRFEGVAVGLYCVWTQKTGLLCAFDDSVRVEPGQTAQPTTLMMHDDASAIRGRILDVDGTPARAMIYSAPSGERRNKRWNELTSDANGEFVIDVAPGSFTDVQFDRSGVKVRSWALLEHVAAGSRGLIVALRPLPVIDIAVHDEKGVDVPMWDVNFHEPTIGGSSYMNQRKEHWKVPASGMSFTLEFRALGFESKTLGPYDASTAPSTLVVTLARAKTITGRVTGAGRPIAHARIRTCSSFPAGAHVGFGFPVELDWDYGGDDTKPDGTFELTVNDDVERTIVIQPWSSESEDAPDGFARTKIGPMNLMTLADRPLEIELQRGGRLEGRVITYSAPASTVAFVSMSCGDGILRSTRIKEDGTYAFEHAAAGDWLVRPTSRDYTNVNSFSTAPPEPSNVSVTIVEGQTTQLDLAIPKTSGATLDGVLHWPDADAGMWTAHLDFTDGVGDWSDTQGVGADGTFHFDAWHGGRHHLTLRMISNDSYSRAFECDVELLPGPNHWELTPHLGAISETSAPARDLTLECRMSDGVTWTAQWRVPSTGLNVLGSVPAGHVMIRSKGRVLGDVDVVAGQPATVRWH